MDRGASEKLDMENSGAALVLVLAGMYLLSGSVFALVSAKWPIFMPDEIDAVAVLLRLLGEPTGTYFAGAVLGLLGGACIYTGAAAVIKRRRVESSQRR
jgi:sulfite exporter TauE/SafE